MNREAKISLCFVSATLMTVVLGMSACSLTINTEGKRCDDSSQCDADQVCDLSLDRPVCVAGQSCSGECDQAGQVYCDGDLLKTCAMGDNGCLGFVQEDCNASGGYCNGLADPPVCRCGCFPGERQCEVFWIQECRDEGGACTEWVNETDCGLTGEVCRHADGGEPTCCSDACGVGETGCDGDVIQTCAVIGWGCTDWEAGIDCSSSGETCDDSSEPAVCVTGCDCVSGTYRCSGREIQFCHDDGVCPSWIHHEDCDALCEDCIEGQGTCALVPQGQDLNGDCGVDLNGDCSARCDGSGQCTLDDGTPGEPEAICCSVDLDCPGGLYCSGGFCCDTPCDQPCNSCGPDNRDILPGTCGPVPAGFADPACPAKDPESCGTTGQCDASGSCAIWNDSTLCGTGDGICSDLGDHYCDSLGQCDRGTLDPDMHRCDVTTIPEHWNDVCIDGTCHTPGLCGDGTVCSPPGPYFPLPPSTPHGAFTLVGMDAAEDNVTGLVWQRCPLDMVIDMGLCVADPPAGPALHALWDDAVQACEDSELMGFMDWYLPDRYELQSVLDYGRSDPAVAFAFLDGANAGAAPYVFWTSSTTAYDGSQAWVVRFQTGEMVPLDKGDPAYVRCVRRNTMPVVERFTRRLMPGQPDGDPVVEDAATGLMWMGCTHGYRGTVCDQGSVASLEGPGDAASMCAGLVWAGLAPGAWRLPDIKELSSLVDARFSDPAVDPGVFPGFDPGPASGWMWSSTQAFEATGFWAVSFLEGDVSVQAANNDYGLLCVRDIP